MTKTIKWWQPKYKFHEIIKLWLKHKVSYLTITLPLSNLSGCQRIKVHIFSPFKCITNMMQDLPTNMLKRTVTHKHVDPLKSNIHFRDERFISKNLTTLSFWRLPCYRWDFKQLHSGIICFLSACKCCLSGLNLIKKEEIRGVRRVSSLICCCHFSLVCIICIEDPFSPALHDTHRRRFHASMLQGRQVSKETDSMS